MPLLELSMGAGLVIEPVKYREIRSMGLLNFLVSPCNIICLAWCVNVVIYLTWISNSLLSLGLMGRSFPVMKARTYSRLLCSSPRDRIKGMYPAGKATSSVDGGCARYKNF